MYLHFTFFSPVKMPPASRLKRFSASDSMKFTFSEKQSPERSSVREASLYTSAWLFGIIIIILQFCPNSLHRFEGM